MIRSFKDSDTEDTFHGRRSKRIPPTILKRARRKLRMVHRSTNLMDLRVPPSNRLEALEGDRKGRFSIRINNQWRICFRWDDGDAYDVEIVDYH